ncbi:MULTISPECIES: hypothetical protein [Massilia]|nr:MULTISPECIES: hypothetical protein [Massilia]QYG02416.1 hypothetical protein KY496_02990 [Massilia sp. NP310]
MEKRKAIVPKLGIAGALSVLVLAWAASAAGAPQSPHVPAMTGEQFVRDMRPLPDSDLASIRRKRAMGYMDGVMDGTAGVRWCPPVHPFRNTRVTVIKNPVHLPVRDLAHLQVP